MKSLNIIIKTLIKINIFAVIAALVTVIVIREQQTAITNEQQKQLEEPIAYRSTVGENPSTIASSEPAATQLERKVKELEGELDRTRERVRGLIARSPTNSPNTGKTDDQQAKNPRPSPTLLSLLIPPSANHLVVPTTTTPQKSNPPDTATRTPNREQATNPPYRERTPNTADRSVKPPEIDPKSYRSPSPGPSSQTRLSSSHLPANLAINPSDTLSIFSKQQIQTIEQTNQFTLATNSSSENRESPSGNPTPEQSANRNNESPVPRTTAISVPTTKLRKDQSISYANDLAIGLLKAANTNSHQYKQYKSEKTLAYRRVQTAISSLRKGNTIEEAARLSQVDKDTLKKLIKLGENRPGKLILPTEISRAEPNLNGD